MALGVPCNQNLPGGYVATMFELKMTPPGPEVNLELRAEPMRITCGKEEMSMFLMKK